MNLGSIVPWGRSLNEYSSMFALSESDLQKNILGCSDGPASFNAELTLLGGSVISTDPIYQFTSAQICARIDQVYPQVMTQVQQNLEDYHWDNFSDVTALADARMSAMQAFLADYDKGLSAERYRCASLPKLPFEDQQFELALCSHFLFLYSDHFTLKEHIDSLIELCRVADEVRIYPLLSLDGELSPHLAQTMTHLSTLGFELSLKTVAYRFQKGANQMLVITACNKKANS